MIMEEKKAIVSSDLKILRRKAHRNPRLRTTTYGDTELDATVTPLLTLLKRIARVSPPPIVAAMKSKLLPNPPNPVCETTTLSYFMCGCLTT